MKAPAGVGLLALLLAACSQTPAPPGHDVAVPPAWTAPPSANGEPVYAHWWRAFGSTELDGLVGRAERDSYQLQAAEARLRQAEANLRISGAALRPSLNGSLDYTRQSRLGGSAEVDGTAYTSGLLASYEVDLRGRLRALQASARAQWQASAYDRDALRLSLTAEVADTWLEQAGLGERQRIAALNLETAQRVLDTLESRYRAGSALPLDVAQQRSLVAGQRRDLREIEQAGVDARARLAVLLGSALPGLALGAPNLDSLRWPRIDSGVPSQLLARRPDIAAAEARLRAADADLAAARAAFFPQLTLSAGVGTEAEHWHDLLANPLGNLAAGLTAPLFSGGRLSGERDQAQGLRDEAVADYRQALIQALGEVEQALNAIQGLEARLAAQQEQTRAADQALRLAESRYRAGAEDVLTLLDTQRTLYSAQDAEAALRQARLQASVTLYRVLGGGWRDEPLPGGQDAQR
ncbi:MAG: Toluene efflux pump outer membrane protein TtgC [Pseudomonas citronellolis]|nr:MAG: Toluene efflux pump outer membrane protein TtgC [Pseudomonas citronellolis]